MTYTYTTLQHNTWIWYPLLGGLLVSNQSPIHPLGNSHLASLDNHRFPCLQHQPVAAVHDEVHVPEVERHRVEFKVIFDVGYLYSAVFRGEETGTDGTGGGDGRA